MIATITLTAAGIDALVDAQNAVTTAIEITEIGLASANFIAAPTLTALPHEFKRIAGIGGEAVSENMIHLVGQDSSDEVYSAYGFGLFLADGTLFGTYSQPTPVVNKVSIASFLIAIDVAFQTSIAAAITFGNANFLNPPATETVQGVARIATNAQADAGADDATIMTPKKVKRVLDAAIAALNAAWAAWQAATDAALAAFEAGVDASIAAIQARSITGGGLATGGGDLTADRVISVAAASGADIDAGTAADMAVTPASLRATSRSIGTQGWIQRPDGLIEMWGFVSGSYSTETSIGASFPVAFPNQVLSVIADTEIGAANSGADFWIQVIRGSITVNGFSAQAQSLSGSSGAISGFSWRALGR